MKDKFLSSLSLIAIDVIPVAHAKIAAALVYKGEVISIGTCQYKSHPMQKQYGRNPMSVFLHAEIDALIKGQKRIESRGIPLKKCTMYVARVKKPYANASGFITGMAKPCEGCMKALTEAGIVNVVYTEG